MTEKQITMHAEAIVDDHGRIKVDDVEGHPIWFDPRDGSMTGDVRGVQITHRTYSTLKKLMVAEHLRSLNNVPALMVGVPGRYTYNFGTGAVVKIASRGKALNPNDAYTTDGRRFGDGDYAAIPLDDAEAVTQVRATLDAFKAERDAEERRHDAVVEGIRERQTAYATGLRKQFPVAAILNRLNAPAVKREEDLRAFAKS